MPLPLKKINAATNKAYTVTEYAIHTKLKQVETLVEENPDKGVILFLDELNRTSREVMSEFMNIILNREINGYRIPDNVFIIAAMNPTATTKGYTGNTSYATTEMDAASKNRLVWIYMEVDAKNWLDYATEKVIKEDPIDVEYKMFDVLNYDTAIDDRVVEYIASSPNMLNVISDNTDASPSPRTWSFVSDILRTFDDNKELFKESHLLACIKGCVGDEAFISFTTFLNNNSNPLIKPETFWKDKTVSEELLLKFQKDTAPRKMIMAKSVIRYVSDLSKLTKDDASKLISILDKLPSDILTSVMRFTKEQHNATHTKLMKNPSYVKLFMDQLKAIS